MGHPLSTQATELVLNRTKDLVNSPLIFAKTQLRGYLFGQYWFLSLMEVEFCFRRWMQKEMLRWWSAKNEGRIKSKSKNKSENVDNMKRDYSRRAGNYRLKGTKIEMSQGWYLHVIFVNMIDGYIFGWGWLSLGAADIFKLFFLFFSGTVFRGFYGHKYNDDEGWMIMQLLWLGLWGCTLCW